MVSSDHSSPTFQFASFRFGKLDSLWCFMIISRDYVVGLNPVLNFLGILETLLRILETLLHDS